jgi:hypothetical protein
VEKLEQFEGYFEIITEDGEDIRVPNWTEKEWNYAILNSLLSSERDEIIRDDGNYEF